MVVIRNLIYGMIAGLQFVEPCVINAAVLRLTFMSSAFLAHIFLCLQEGAATLTDAIESEYARIFFRTNAK